MPQGIIFDVQRYSINDGPGIRTTVFMKGCPLRCLWCSNPESQKAHPQLMYFSSLCTLCYKCVQGCPTGATSIAPGGFISINANLCTACGQCVPICPTGARVVKGQKMDVEETFALIKKDELFYRNSGGGVTVSGGEALQQPQFLSAFFRKCREYGMHTVLDTCGYAPWPTLQEVLKYVDLALYDLKHMDSQQHFQLTGVDNAVILENAIKMAATGVEFIIRIPFFKGYNDSLNNVEALNDFIRKLGARKMEIVPYHKLGIRKYQALGRNYSLVDLEQYSKNEIEKLKQHLQFSGAEVSIS